jgi:putative membrane protein
LFALFFGIGISIISLAKGIKWLLENKPILLWSYFFGLVIASILLIGKQISKYDIKSITAIVLASILSYLITISEPFSSPENHLYLLFSGAIGIIAMILPGVSGAFILLLLGAYHTIIGSISDITTGIKESNLELVKTSFINLFVFGIGALLGLKLFSKVLNWLFKNYKNLTLSILVGFMVGSLNKIWPWKKVMQYRINSKGEEVPFIEKSISPFNEHIIDPKFTYALLFLIIGFLTIYLLEKFSQSKKK